MRPTWRNWPLSRGGFLGHDVVKQTQESTLIVC
jgi:hypothetical protein